jgi:energy-coupling factor transport system substrate-specific component
VNLAIAIVILTAAAVAVLAAMYVRAVRRSVSPVSYLSLTAVMTALSVVGRAVFAPVSGFKPCTAVIIVTGISLGSEAGFICGAFTALVSNIYFGQGIWTVFQMASWGLIGFLSGVFSAGLRKRRTMLYAFGAVSGFVYSAVMDLFSVIWQDGEFNPLRFAATAAGSFPFAVIYAVSNVIFLMILGRRLVFSISRISERGFR